MKILTAGSKAGKVLECFLALAASLFLSLAGISPGHAQEGSGNNSRVPSARNPLVIRPVQTEEWQANLGDVEKVLYSAAGELWRYFPERTLEPILVEPKGGPVVLFQRGPKGEYTIRLGTGGLFWCQYAFQFAHEFCHILCKFESTERNNKWFEESICELASLFVLRKMCETWKVKPPYPNWKDYAPALKSYADERISNGQLPEKTTLARWYKDHEAELRENPCLREKNCIIAAALLPLFEKYPWHWESVQYLNEGASKEARSFKQYMEDWLKNSPEKHRGFIRLIAREFGVPCPHNFSIKERFMQCGHLLRE